jgi:hypothetical protein
MSVKMLPVTCKSDGKDKELSCNLLIFEPFESCKKNRGYQIENSQSITTSQFCIEYGVQNFASGLVCRVNLLLVAFVTHSDTASYNMLDLIQLSLVPTNYVITILYRMW